MKGILLEIQGCTTAFTSTETTAAASVVSWGATTIVEAIRAPLPNSAPLSVDPFNGTFSSGGTAIGLTKSAGILTARASSPSTTLTSNASATDLFVNVASTAGFSATGVVYIDSEAIKYTTIAGPTQISGLTRGALGTTAASHSTTSGKEKTKTKVEGFNPFIVGRRAKISWYDVGNPLYFEVHYVGFVDDVSFDRDGFSLALVSNAKIFQDAEVMAGQFATGEFLGAFFSGQTTPLKDLKRNQRGTNAIFVALDSNENSFPDPGSGTLHYKIGSEVFLYGISDNPAVSSRAGSYIGTSATYGNYFDTNGAFLLGDTISWTYASEEVFARITYIAPAPAPPTSDKRFTVYHSRRGASGLGGNPVAGDLVSTPGKQKLSPLFRARLQTKEEEHKIGTEVKEVRRVFGNHAKVVLSLLLSDGTGSGSYNEYPSSWSAGISASDIDVASFEELFPLCDDREFLFEGPVQVSTLLSQLARITGARIYVNALGMLTAKVEKEIYPSSAGEATITTEELEAGSIPVWNPQMSNLYNFWAFKGNAIQGGDFKDFAFFENSSSVAKYGKRALSDYEDPGMLLSKDAAKLRILATSVLARWSVPNSILQLVVSNCNALFLDPGMLVQVNLPHLPDFTGAAGINALFEVLEWTPNDQSNTIAIRLAQYQTASNVRLIAPAAEVKSVAGSVLTLEAAAASHLADPLGKFNIDPVMTEPGDEDVDYFKENLTIQVIDRSTPTNKHATTISAIDYPNNKITLAALPGWTIAAGDIVRLDSYATTKAAFSDFVDYYAFLSTTSTAVLGSDPAHEWGL